jgi:hypothetical protein
MARAKPKSRTTPGVMRDAAAQVTAYLEAHQHTPAQDAIKTLGLPISAKSYHQHMQRVRAGKLRGRGRLTQDFPLDAIPNRPSKAKPNGSGETAYAAAKRRRGGELDTAFKLIEMGLAILRRQL